MSTEEGTSTPTETHPVEASDNEEENPWSSSSAEAPDSSEARAVDGAPEPPLEIADEPEPSHPKPLEQSTLDEFDPLADTAADAWRHAEGHLPVGVEASASGPEIRFTQEPDTTLDEPPQSRAQAQTPLSGVSTDFPHSPSSPPGVPSPTTLASLAQPLRRASQHELGETEASSSQQTNGNAMDTSGPKVTPPFDFQKFLDQMKSKSAEPVAKYLRSFLHNFQKRTFPVTDQVKLIHDFLAFIAARMSECEVWKNLPVEQFDNATEAMEKLVMNRLYHLAFTPAIDRNIYPITTDDLERDHVLSQRIRLFEWVTEEHLDIPTGEGSKGFIMFAEQELLKINHYKAPRDKLICILNCCKVIFGLIRHLNREEGADAFIPILIYVVLQANPDHLLSNVEYISRFRSATKLQSEAGYYLSSLMGAVSFIETMDHTSLSNISQEEFEANVEEAVTRLSPSSSPGPMTPQRARPPAPEVTTAEVTASAAAGEESARPLLLPTTLAEDTKKFFQRTGDFAQQTISKPLNAIGRIFSEALEEPPGVVGRALDAASNWVQPNPVTPAPPPKDQSAPLPAPYKPRVRQSPSRPNSGASTPIGTPTRVGGTLQPFPSPLGIPPVSTPRTATPDHDGDEAFDFAALSAEIDRAHDAAQASGRDTLLQIFPGLDGELADVVLEATNGDLGLSIDKLLEMGVGS
ncbi:hypothetical protein DACRYDRAFT_21223 [Dacryopinax primogenitus]|uniref:VPS9 domain-containing protein n=1 Tax=Dacryopinax primogenitus (strain DJM 731) TaxID=1858805 RepID=M5GF26_DACPD|nr:uncharacterized protein DACRYDRAFT_21223 [Dacryopinax primogenitus]EJU03773.1 hypothetical protein DACRYDRAFT_21223 [Dacryopinax primogenitus]